MTTSSGNSMVPLSNAIGWPKFSYSYIVLLNIQENIPLAIFWFYPLSTYSHITHCSERHFGGCTAAVREKDSKCMNSGYSPDQVTWPL